LGYNKYDEEKRRNCEKWYVMKAEMAVGFMKEDEGD